MNEHYESPLTARYASPAMQRLWSAPHRASLWRRLWLTLAETQKDLGLKIPDAALKEMRAHLDDANLKRVAEHERRLRHDVMAHIHAFGDDAPDARAFIHLGATSAFVTDNAELIVMRAGMSLLLGRLVAVLRALSRHAREYRAVPSVAYTHFQPAQLTTVGKRITLWMQDFALDAAALHEAIRTLPFRGCKGTTGTQASFLELFEGNHRKVRDLDTRVSQHFGFAAPIAVSGQTYTRKIDSRVLDLLSGIGQSASKFATDLRLLQHEGEVLEPAEKDQVGSSAMPYKRNPMRAERICGLSRYVIGLREQTAYTAATQWLERTLDDSANRRLVLPDAFLATDAVLILATNVAAGLEVRRDTVRRNVERVMPFTATERWLMLGVKAGGDRQKLHEVIRVHARAVAEAIEKGEPNDLLDRLSGDPGFAKVKAGELKAEMDPSKYVGRAPEQVDEYLAEVLEPLLETLKTYDVAETAEVAV